MTTEWEWIVPFKGRNHSGSVEQNFLCRAGNVYVMDNHRAALWCWLQELDLTAPHSLIHIDRHPDALQSRLDEWLKHLPSWAAGIDAYLSVESHRSCPFAPCQRFGNTRPDFGSSTKVPFFVTGPVRGGGGGRSPRGSYADQPPFRCGCTNVRSGTLS